MDLHPIDIALHVVNIVVLYILLRMWVFKPVRAFLSKRQESVAKKLSDASDQQHDAAVLKAELTEKLSSVRDTCDELMAESRQKGADQAQKIVDNAECKARSILDETRQVAQAQRQQILDSAKVDMADIAVTMAARILKFDQNLLTQTLEPKKKTATLSGVVKTVGDCDKDTKEKMQALLENILGVYLKLSWEVEPALMGGFSAFVDGQVYDFSYATQLDTMQKNLS